MDSSWRTCEPVEFWILGGEFLRWTLEVLECVSFRACAISRFECAAKSEFTECKNGKRFEKFWIFSQKETGRFWRLGKKPTAPAICHFFSPLRSIVSHCGVCMFSLFTVGSLPFAAGSCFEAGSDERCSFQAPLAVKVWFAIWTYHMQSTCGICHSHSFAWVSDLYTCSTLVRHIHINVCVCVCVCPVHQLHT